MAKSNVWNRDRIINAGEKSTHPAFTCSKVNDGNTTKYVKICSKLTIKTRRSVVFIVNLEQISNIVVVFPSLTFGKQIPAGK